MNKLFAVLAFLVASSLTASTSHAGLISGFEPGLNGWEYMGDVSIQTSAIGLTPTQAQRMAFISTMCGGSPPVQGFCDTTIQEHPYSGVSSPTWVFAAQFLGLPSTRFEFLNVMPPLSYIEQQGIILNGESGAMKTLFYAP